MEQEPLSAIEARDNAWRDRAPPWSSRLFGRIREMITPNLFVSWEVAWKMHETDFQLLMARLAIQWYRQEHDNRLPATLDALVPKYLAAVPHDPFTGKPLFYCLTVGDYRLGAGRDDETTEETTDAGAPNCSR